MSKYTNYGCILKYWNRSLWKCYSLFIIIIIIVVFFCIYFAMVWFDLVCSLPLFIFPLGIFLQPLNAILNDVLGRRQTKRNVKKTQRKNTTSESNEKAHTHTNYVDIQLQNIYENAYSQQHTAQIRCIFNSSETRKLDGEYKQNLFKHMTIYRSRSLCY